MGHRSRSRSRDSRERSRRRKSSRKSRSSERHRSSRRHRHRSRSRSSSRNRSLTPENRHTRARNSKTHRRDESHGFKSDSPEADTNVIPSDIKQEFERSNFSKAYGLDLSQFAGLTSEILAVTEPEEERKLTRFERRKLREHEIKNHQDRFWKCKKCDFMNYLSNYECKRCKGLRASCALKYTQ